MRSTMTRGGTNSGPTGTSCSIAAPSISRGTASGPTPSSSTWSSGARGASPPTAFCCPGNEGLSGMWAPRGRGAPDGDAAPAARPDPRALPRAARGRRRLAGDEHVGDRTGLLRGRRSAAAVPGTGDRDAVRQRRRLRLGRRGVHRPHALPRLDPRHRRRPRVQYFEGDSTGANREPYRIVADRLHLRGNNLIWAGGNVRVDRSDLAATADSMRLDTGAGNDGMLLGRPVFRGLGGDSFTVAGRRIDFALHRREVTHVTATDSARATHGEWTLTADTISMDVASRKVTAMLAWGRQSRPHAVSARHELRADSLAFDLPDQALKQVRAFGDAWVGGPPDSTGHDRDWLAGDTVIADFVQRDSAGSKRSVLGGLVARHGARSFHRVAAKERGTAPSLAYVRGDAITIVMRADSAEAVDRVEVRGHVDGAQLDPGTPSSPAGSAPSPGGAP